MTKNDKASLKKKFFVATVSLQQVLIKFYNFPLALKPFQ